METRQSVASRLSTRCAEPPAVGARFALEVEIAMWTSWVLHALGRADSHDRHDAGVAASLVTHRAHLVGRALTLLRHRSTAYKAGRPAEPCSVAQLSRRADVRAWHVRFRQCTVPSTTLRVLFAAYEDLLATIPSPATFRPDLAAADPTVRAELAVALAPPSSSSSSSSPPALALAPARAANPKVPPRPAFATGSDGSLLQGPGGRYVPPRTNTIAPLKRELPRATSSNVERSRP